MNCNFKKVCLFLIIYFFSILPSSANLIANYINDSNLGFHSTISAKILNLSKNKVLYKQNELKLLNPASVLKVFSFGSVYKTLGKDYNFETALYKYNNDLYLKLGADTLLTFNDLKYLFNQSKEKFNYEKINNIYIDDSIIDKIPYPNGWMQDDMWPNQRAISPYIINSNYVNILIRRSSLSTVVDIIQNDDYKLPIINELKLSQACVDDKISIEKTGGENSSIITFKGCVSKDTSIKLPVLNPEINFKIKLKQALVKNDIVYLKGLDFKKVPQNALKIASISHSIQDVSKDILLNSDNFAAEVAFKVGAAKFINYSKSATLDDAINMFYMAYPNEIKENVKISDASGVSRYNLINCETIINLMIELSKIDGYYDLLASAGVGTLNNRLLFLKDNLRAKTGTLSNMSSIVAIFTTKNGNKILLSSIVQNSMKRSAILKNYENGLISLVYRKY